MQQIFTSDYDQMIGFIWDRTFSRKDTLVEKLKKSKTNKFSVQEHAAN